MATEDVDSKMILQMLSSIVLHMRPRARWALKEFLQGEAEGMGGTLVLRAQPDGRGSTGRRVVEAAFASENWGEVNSTPRHERR